jgi:hypothetical protein
MMFETAYDMKKLILRDKNDFDNACRRKQIDHMDLGLFQLLSHDHQVGVKLYRLAYITQD